MLVMADTIFESDLICALTCGMLCVRDSLRFMATDMINGKHGYSGWSLRRADADPHHGQVRPMPLLPAFMRG